MRSRRSVVPAASMAAGRLAGDWLRARFGAVPLVRWSACLAAAGLVVALVVPWPLVAIAGFGVVGLGLANLVPVFFGAAGRIPGQAPGAAIAARHCVQMTREIIVDQPPSPMHPALVTLLEQVIARRGRSQRRLISGPGHDAMVIARRFPTGVDGLGQIRMEFGC